MKNKLLSLLGLVRRAGRLSMGNDPVLESIRKGESRLLLATSDLSPRTLKGIQTAANDAQISLFQLPVSMMEMNGAIGKRVGILSINDPGFAKKIAEYCHDITEQLQLDTID